MTVCSGLSPSLDYQMFLLTVTVQIFTLCNVIPGNIFFSSSGSDFREPME
jgi:hypothetical protein